MASASQKTRLVIASYPDLESLASNPYWRILAECLDQMGLIRIRDAQFSIGWLLLQRRRVDVLHFHYVQQFYAFADTNAKLSWVLRLGRNLIVARALGYRTIFTLHNLQPTFPLSPNWVDYLGHWFAVNLTSAVIVHCEQARLSLRDRYLRCGGVHVVQHPHMLGVVPNTISREAARAILGLPKSSRVFLFFGGVRPNKGVERLIEVFKTLAGGDLRLVVAGKPGGPPEYIDRIAELAANDDRVILHLRFIDDASIQNYMNAADVVVLPFAKILTSGSTILAMSFGRAVVAPAMGCLSELLSPNCGILYDPTELNSLRETLESCFAADLNVLGAAARDRVRTFRTEEFARLTVQSYGK